MVRHARLRPVPAVRKLRRPRRGRDARTTGLRPAAGLLAAACLLGAACAGTSETAGGEPTPRPAHTAAPRTADGRFPPPPPRGLDLHLPAPEDNRLTPERAALGRRLFFDPVLSRDSTLACASCHRPELGFADTLPRSPGVDGRTGRRATPTLVNRGYGASFFWDGRAASLEEAVLLPIDNSRELDLPLDSLVARLSADVRYRRLFLRAYGTAPSRGSVARALASFVRLIRSGDAPADRSSSDRDEALSAAARRGRRLFLGKAGCFACHPSPNLTDERFHDTGVAARSAAGGRSADPGRGAITGREEDRGTFKTPALRDVARRAPYMHDGSLANLEEVVRFYDRGGGPSPSLDPEIRSLDLSEREIDDLVAFLESLSGRLEAPGADGRPVPVGPP